MKYQWFAQTFAEVDMALKQSELRFTRGAAAVVESSLAYSHYPRVGCHQHEPLQIGAGKRAAAPGVDACGIQKVFFGTEIVGRRRVEACNRTGGGNMGVDIGYHGTGS